MIKEVSGALLVAMLLTAVAASATSSQVSRAGQITPADVLEKVELLRANLELIRQALEEDPAGEPILQVRNAQPAEVYSQARNLEQLAFEFAFEKTRRYRPPSTMILGEVTPAEVEAVFDNALHAILSVNTSLEIKDSEAVVAPAVNTRPADVFNAAVAAGNTLNKLMKRETTPGNVFQIVNTATYLATNLHSVITGKPELPAPPALESDRSSTEVFVRMQRCFELIKALAAYRGLQTLEFDVDPSLLSQVGPDDVRDLAFLLVEELHIIHQNTPGASEPGQVYTPGEKRPAQVYQRVGLLELILSELVAAELGSGL